MLEGNVRVGTLILLDRTVLRQKRNLLLPGKKFQLEFSINNKRQKYGNTCI